jgi:hypothetical protein
MAGIVLSLPEDVKREEGGRMAFIHNVEIVWGELMDAFSSGTGDRVYFLDRFTGEIFFVPAAMDDDDFWRQMETQQERFLEIPRFDYGIERQLLSDFICSIEEPGLQALLRNSLAGRKPYGNFNDILSFYPDENDKLLEMKDEFFTSRVKHWLEEHDLFTLETKALLTVQV